MSMGVGMAASSDLAADERTGLQEKQRILSAQIQQDREHAQALRTKISKTKEVGLFALRGNQSCLLDITEVLGVLHSDLARWFRLVIGICV